MIRGLTQVTWERVDVCFHESRLKYNAHYNIQVSFNTGCSYLASHQLLSRHDFIILELEEADN
jgi:hypothetical protein